MASGSRVGGRRDEATRISGWGVRGAGATRRRGFRVGGYGGPARRGGADFGLGGTGGDEAVRISGWGVRGAERGSSAGNGCRPPQRFWRHFLGGRRPPSSGTPDCAPQTPRRQIWLRARRVRERRRGPGFGGGADFGVGGYGGPSEEVERETAAAPRSVSGGIFWGATTPFQRHA